MLMHSGGNLRVAPYMSVISYPVPPYQNQNIEYVYSPDKFVISAISLGMTTTVTTSVDHDYVIGQQVRLIIPPAWGSRQLNKKTAYVIDIPASNQVLLNLNSVGSDTFVNPGYGQDAQIVAIGSINTGPLYDNGLATYIPGSFRNIS